MVSIAVMQFRAAAPVRLDFAGGWTDVPPYSAREGGMVVSAAVQLHAYAEVVLRDVGYVLISKDLEAASEFPDAAALQGDGPLALLRAGLRLLKAAPCSLSSRSDARRGAAWAAREQSTSPWWPRSPRPRGVGPRCARSPTSPAGLEAEEAGIPGGRQDQFTAAFGGFLQLTFRDPDATVERLVLDPEFVAELERRMLLCYTGASRSRVTRSDG